MRSVIGIAAAAMLAITATSAHAQFGGLLGKIAGLPPEGEAGGAYQPNNQIRTYISTKPFTNIDLYGAVIVKAAEMTGAKSFTRFGVTKINCSTMLMNGSPVSKSCYIIAIMLNDGEQAKPRGKHQVHYYSVSDVQAGRIVRPVQD